MFTQTPDPNKAVLITGKLETPSGTIPTGVNQILTENDNFLNVAYMQDNGNYRIYAQKVFSLNLKWLMDLQEQLNIQRI